MAEAERDDLPYSDTSPITLMADVGNEVALLEEAVQATPGVWRSLDVRSVAIRLWGEWHNLLTLVRLDCRDVAHLPPDEILAETSSVLALRTRLPELARASLITDVCTGKCVLQNRTIRFERDIRANRVPYNHAYCNVATKLYDRPTDAVGVGHQLGIAGDIISTIIDAFPGGAAVLDRELWAAEEPWDGLSALVEHGLEWAGRFPHLSAQLLVSAPLATGFQRGTGRLTNGELAVVIETENPSLETLCSVGYVARIDRAVHARGSWRAPQDRGWIPAEHSRLWVMEEQLDLPEGPPHDVQLFLRVGPFVVDRLRVVDERRRIRHVLRTAYLAVDEEMRSLEAALLQPRGSQQVKFEGAVGRALLLAGFVVDSYADNSQLKEWVDLVAHAPEQGVLLVVECTTGALQSRDGKLSRLAMRARTISAALRTSSGESETQVVALIATPLPQSEVGQWDQTGADADNIVVLDGAALAQILAIARGGQGPQEVLALLQERTRSTTRLSRVSPGAKPS